MRLYEERSDPNATGRDFATASKPTAFTCAPAMSFLPAIFPGGRFPSQRILTPLIDLAEVDDDKMLGDG